jgi:isopenicillin-N epimerase
VTTGLNAVARSIELRRGDEILLTDHEYGAKRILWDEVAARAGAKVVVATLPRPALGEDELFDAVAARFTARTRVLFVSHITSLSALVLPVARLSALARERSVVSIVDGAHAPGQVDLDLPAIGCDIYAGNLHKWVCAPRGSAFVWATAESQTWLRGPVVSWDWSWSGPEAFQGRFGWSGTTDPTALLSVPAAFRFQREHAWRQVRRRCNVSRSRPWPRSRPRPCDPARRRRVRAPQMASFSIPCADPAGVQRHLWRRHRIEIPGEMLYDLSLLRALRAGVHARVGLRAPRRGVATAVRRRRRL